MRLLLLDGVAVRGKKRRETVRILTRSEVEAQATQVIRAAAASGREVINVYTGLVDNRSTAYSGTDMILTVGFPGGEAVAWFKRGAGGVAPGIANQCLSLHCYVFGDDRRLLLN